MLIKAGEAAKYEEIWQLPEYANTSPGELRSTLFGQVAQPQEGDTLIDLGCGKGAGGLALQNAYGVEVTYLDIVKVNGVPEPFIEQPLWVPLQVKAKYGYCCDVMEHLPKEFVMLAISNILNSCEYAFFNISFVPDHFGQQYLQKPLHLTVENFTWWRDRFSEIGELHNARDFLGEGVYYVSE